MKIIKDLKKLFKEDELNKLKENTIHGQKLAQIGSWTYDVKKDEIYLTDEIYNIIECSPEEFDGEPENYYRYVHPDDLEEVKVAIQGSLKGNAYDIGYRLKTPSGKEKYVHEVSKALYDVDGNPIKVIGILQDITKQKIVENNLKSLGDNLSQAQRVSGVGYWKYDAIKDEIFWSDEIYKIFNVSPTDFERNYNNFLEMIYPDDRINMQKSIDTCLAGKAYQLEYRIPQLDGSLKYVMTNGEPVFNIEGQVIGIIGTLQDISKNKTLELELKRNYKILTQGQALAHVGSWELDLINNKSIWSQETYKIYGITMGQYDNTYEGFLKYVYPEDMEIIQNLLSNPPKEPFDMEFRIVRFDGSIRNIYQRVEYVFDNKDKPIYVYGTIQDITEKRMLQKEVEKKQHEIDKIQKRFQVLFHESNEVYEIIEPDGTIKYISEAVEKVIGLKPEVRIGKKVYDFYEGTQLQKLRDMIDFVLSNPDEEAIGDIELIVESGKVINLEVQIRNMLNNPIIEGLVINFRDITKRIEMEQNIARISNHDDLTGLPNQVYFIKELYKRCQHANGTKTKFGIMMLYIKELNYVNYTLGYELGDKLLIKIVQRLSAYLGNDKFVSRYFGDHFAIIVEGLKTDEEYEKVAKELIALFNQPYKVEQYELVVSINIGICILSDSEKDTVSLVNHSLSTLLRAKREGKNRYKFYSSSFDVKNYKEFLLCNDIRLAVEKQQLRIYYQPIVNLQTNDILAAEALVRWEHHEWGLIEPDEFIYLAEETGLIIEIGNWVLSEVCVNYKKWLQEGMSNIKVSVNYSSYQFLQNNFADNVINIINNYKLDPHFLIIEITESVLIEKTDELISGLQKLKSAGIQVALDDFGTGYSSLSYLNDYEIDILKIDCTFVKKLQINNRAAAITKSIINLAKELKIKMVAEGIENSEQLNLLKGLNCYAGQGFIFNRPVPLEDFKNILVKKKCIPIAMNNTELVYEARRKYFRLDFNLLLEANMTILEIKGRKINVGNTKVLVKNIGPGGLCFIANLKLPVEKDFILQYTMTLLEKELKVYGCIVWENETGDNIYEYGVEFTFDENKRTELTQILNQTQIKMRNNLLFSEGSFISESPDVYFSKNK